MSALKITYYLEVISSWCFWAEPAWAGLKERYGSRATCEAMLGDAAAYASHAAHFGAPPK